MGHTPGPWTFGEGRDNRHYEVDQMGTGGGAWSSICEVAANTLGSREVTAAEAEANARLIAAAPDLLAACKRVLLAEEWSYTGDRLSSSERAEILRAAIAKAEKSENSA